ncbi:hypothetical protein ACFXDE_01590 [Kitasatospora sp. NPDC059408]|uniref:hypothetical protein n=1 Tax=Kitasatospora sp. NPDC059408 TaxID=3346823 RepID=UPI00368255F0
MITQPTQSPRRPVRHARRSRPQMMAALALAETIVAFGEPVPYGVRLHWSNRRAVVDVHLDDAQAVFAYQGRFGGVVHQELRLDDGGCGVRLQTELAGSVYDGEFLAWSQVRLSERDLAAWFVGDHGDPADWSSDTVVAYRRALELVHGADGAR